MYEYKVGAVKAGVLKGDLNFSNDKKVLSDEKDNWPILNFGVEKKSCKKDWGSEGGFSLMTSNDQKVWLMRSGVFSGELNFGLEKSLAPKNARISVIF